MWINLLMCLFMTVCSIVFFASTFFVVELFELDHFNPNIMLPCFFIVSRYFTNPNPAHRNVDWDDTVTITSALQTHAAISDFINTFYASILQIWQYWPGVKQVLCIQATASWKFRHPHIPCWCCWNSDMEKKPPLTGSVKGATVKPFLTRVPIWRALFICSSGQRTWQLFKAEDAICVAVLRCLLMVPLCPDRVDGVMRTMNTEKLLKTIPIIQNQMDALLDFNVSRRWSPLWCCSFKKS